MPDTWWRLVTEQRHREDIPTRLKRRHFEVCVFTQLMSELKSGDLCLPGSDQFADYREQLISWEDYHRDVAEYVQMIGIPAEANAFVVHMKGRLTETALATDRGFPDNADLRIEKGRSQGRDACRAYRQ